MMFVSTACIAQEVGVSGQAAYILDTDKVVELPNGNSLAYVRLQTVLIEDDPSSIQHLMSQDCSGVNLMSSDGVPIQIGGSCTGVDADGELLRIAYLNTAEAGTRHYTGGTGNYTGASGGGTSLVSAIGHAGRITIRYSGTMTMPGSE